MQEGERKDSRDDVINEGKESRRKEGKEGMVNGWMDEFVLLFI